MKPGIDIIVDKLPPPGKGGGDDEVAEGEAPADDYNPEQEAAMGVARALGIPEGDVDVEALCSALRDFNATTSGPTPEE